MKRFPPIKFGLVLAALLLLGLVSLTQAQIAPAEFLPGDDTLAPTAGDQSAPAIAQGDDAALAVWSDGRALVAVGGYEGETSRDIYGVRLDANGNVLDALPIAITAARSNQENPQVAWNGANWLVVFESYSLGGTGYYYQKSLAAVRVSPAGQVLDSQPIPIYGVAPTVGQWSLASDGNNWVVAFQGASASYDLMALRISPTGVVLDPPTHSLVPATYYVRSNLHLAYAGGVFLLTFNDAYVNGTYDTKAVRFDSNLTLLDATPISLLSVPLNGLASNASEFYIVWHQQQPNFSIAVTGSRVNPAGQKLDGDGVNISKTNQPQAYTTTAVVWDGANWKVTWGYNDAVSVARVNASGQLLDPGGVSVPGPSTGLTAATATGGVQLVWTAYNNSNNDVNTANISAGNVAGPNRTISVGAPMQLRADVATNGNGYMMVYRSLTASENRIMAQPLDANGLPVGLPVQLESGDSLTGPGSPAVAWNGALYMAAWGNSSGIVAQRLNPDGSQIDAAPFLVMTPGFGPADLEAMGDTFLVVGLQFGFNVEIINPIAARVRGSDGAVLDPTPKIIGGSYSSKPRVAVLGGRWLVAWQQNATHDNPSASTMAVFVNPDGTSLTPFSVYSYSTAGGNGIFDLGLASSGSVALAVQSAELSSGVETDLVARLINADGALQPAINLTPWIGNQYRPRAAWDGSQFVVVYQDQKNRLAEWSLEQLDARSDLFGMRIGSAGSIIDPQGFVFSASALAEAYPTVAAADSVSLIAGSVMRNQAPYTNYRVGYTRFGLDGNQWPVAMASASPADGDVPLTVNFSSAGSTDPDGALAAYLWDFGDGGASTEANPSHIYTTGGPFVATLTLTDDGGATATQTVLVKAVNPNQMPVANASADPASGPAPLAVTFYATGSYDPDGFLGNFYWTFGDGWDYWGSVAYHTFNAPGTYQVTLTVYDSQGATGTDSITVQVGQSNQPPVAVASADPTSGQAPLSVNFSSAGSTDPDGTIVAYAWNLGDGGSSSEANPSHTYQTPGAYNARLTVTDDQGGTDSDQVTITVNSSGCASNCLRSTAINLSYQARGSTATVNGRVTVKNENGANVQGATVYATWTLPSGATQSQSAVTNSRGIAQFRVRSGFGVYTLTVTDITKTGSTFDPANSVLSASITTS